MEFEDYYEIGEECYVKGEYKKAIEYFEKCIIIRGSYDCLNYIGCCYLAMKDYDSATSIFKNLINQCPQSERPMFNLGRVYLKQDKMNEAFDCFQKAISINSYSEDAYYYLGVYYEKIHNLEQARICYEKSLSIDFEKAETHLNLGICYHELCLYQDSLKEFELAYKYDNKCLLARLNKGFVYLDLEDYANALDEFLFISRINAGDMENITDIVHCYYKLGDYQNANNWIRKALNIEPNNEYINKMLKKISSKLL